MRLDEGPFIWANVLRWLVFTKKWCCPRCNCPVFDKENPCEYCGQPIKWVRKHGKR